MNDNNNDHVIDEKFLFISSIIFQKVRDRKEISDIDIKRLHFKNVNNIS